jgi:hypothetical protein
MCRRSGLHSARVSSALAAMRAIAAGPQAQACRTCPHWATRRAASAAEKHPAQTSPVISPRP